MGDRGEGNGTLKTKGRGGEGTRHSREAAPALSNGSGTFHSCHLRVAPGDRTTLDSLVIVLRLNIYSANLHEGPLCAKPSILQKGWNMLPVLRELTVQQEKRVTERSPGTGRGLSSFYFCSGQKRRGEPLAVTKDNECLSYLGCVIKS